MDKQPRARCKSWRSGHPATRARWRFAGVATVAVMIVTGCGSGDSGADTDSTAEITIAEQAIADFAPVWIGASEGIFADHGLEVEVVSGAASSAGQVPLVLSGKADLAATTATSVLQADAENIPVQIVGGLTVFGSAPDEDQGGLIATADTTMESYADLEGAVVAVSGLESVTHALVQEAIEQDGGELSAVQFIQAPMSNIANLVATGGADAGFVVDPFLAAALADDMTLLGRPAHEVAAGFPATSIVATRDFVTDHADTLERFAAALAESAEYASAHPDVVTDVVAEEIGIPPEQLAGSIHPVFDAVVDVELLAAEAQMLAGYGSLPGAVDDAGSIVWAPPDDE